MKTLRSTTQVINALGGNQAVALLLRTTPKAVSNWRRMKFPANTFVVLQATLLGMDIDAPHWLWAMKKGNRKHRTRNHDSMDQAGRRPVRAALHKRG